MARKEKTYHFIYKTTNQLNGKFYVGMHSTDNLNDGYIGSGYKLRRSINKYGKENFKIEVLEFLPDRSSLKAREKELVNEALLKDPMCMNLVYGGNGGFISVDGYKKGAKRMNEIVWSNPEYRKRKSEWKSEQNKILWETGKLKYVDNWTGRKHKEETKLKIGKINSIKQKGENNSQFGTCWITNGIENKKIKKTDFHLYKEWKLGRV
jgi:group I intron endonuclease